MAHGETKLDEGRVIYLIWSPSKCSFARLFSLFFAVSNLSRAARARCGQAITSFSHQRAGPGGRVQVQRRGVGMGQSLSYDAVLSVYQKGIRARRSVEETCFRRSDSHCAVKRHSRGLRPLHELLDTLLAVNGIAMVVDGAGVRTVRSTLVTNVTAPNIDLPADELPDSYSYMSRAIPLTKH